MDLSKPAVTRRRRRQRRRFLPGRTRAASRPIRSGCSARTRGCDPPIDPRHRVRSPSRATSRWRPNFSEWGLGDHLTLPDDWGKWAAVGRALVDRSTSDVRLAMTNWDIHDDSLTTEGHIITDRRRAVRRARRRDLRRHFDAVDNCTDAERPPRAASRRCSARSRRAGYTIGPFDPIYPYDTMLSDGKVDAGDAPMPAAQIDVDDRARTTRRPDRHQRRRLPLPELQDRGLQP